MILFSPFCKSVARRQHLLWRQEREQRIRVSVCMQAHTSLSPPKHCGQKFRTGGCCYVVKLRFCMLLIGLILHVNSLEAATFRSIQALTSSYLYFQNAQVIRCHNVLLKENWIGQ